MSDPLVRGAARGRRLRCWRSGARRSSTRISTAVERELGAALDDPAVRGARCVVITGGERAFSAGADVTEMRDMDPAAILAYYRDTGGVYERVARLPQPTIAAIAGFCLGGGFELATATDFRVADAGATFGLPEVNIGIVPELRRDAPAHAAARDRAGRRS